MTTREAVEALTADEIAELREAPMLLHTYDAYRLVRLLLDRDTPSPDAGELAAREFVESITAYDDLGAAWREAEAALPEHSMLDLMRFTDAEPYVATIKDGEHLPFLASANGPTPAAALHALRAALTPPAAPETGEPE